LNGIGNGARSGLRIGSPADCRNDGETIGAGSEHVVDVRSLQPADCDRWYRADIDEPREAIKADRLLVIRLGRGGKHRPDAGVVHEFRIDGRSKRFRLDRETEDHLGADPRPGGANEHIVLPDMQTVGTDRDGGLDVIVDDKKRTGAGKRRLQGATGLDHLRCRCVLVAQLHHRRTAGNRSACGLDHADASAEIRIEDKIERKIDVPHVWLILAFWSRSLPSMAARLSRKRQENDPGPPPCAPPLLRQRRRWRVLRRWRRMVHRGVAAKAPTRHVSEQPSAVT
jgi:hypothetical protein